MSPELAGPADAPGLALLLDYLKGKRGFDFSGYKRASLERRIARRMEAVGVAGYGDYVDYLEVHPDEFATLFNTILIHVTRFFRDAPAWEHLETEVVPKLLAARPGDEPIRVWSAGCASGEEAYAVAMVLADALGEDGYRERVKIYATDVDEQLLAAARQGSYGARQLEGVSPARLARYFEPLDRGFAFRKDLRRNVIFGRNDLLQDAPISRIDLLTCRNTLMYFNAEAQASILRHFHFALNDGAFLFLGKSEMLVAHAHLFAPLGRGRRVFQKVRTRAPRSPAAASDGAHNGAPATFDPATQTGANGTGETLALRDSAYDASPVAQVLIEAGGTVIGANQHARERFAVRDGDLGRPLEELELWTRPIELRPHLRQAYGERRPVFLPGVAHAGGGHEGIFDIQIVPLLAGEVARGASITLTDVTAQHQLREELERSKHELEHAYEELQSAVEELETTNEELQSTNEELETTNEELQSTNEELETMNEELQSTNEELETMNEELRNRSRELNEVNAFLETILSSMGTVVVMVDRQLTIKVWNTHAEELWGLRPEEAVGEHLLSIDIGLPVASLKAPLRAVLAGQRDSGRVELEATTRRGKAIVCAITILPLRLGEVEIGGAILLMEPQPPSAP